MRWTGALGNHDEVDVEIWQIKGLARPIVEVSLKKKRRDAAEKAHKELEEFLDDGKWLAGEQLLKTGIILKNYAAPSRPAAPDRPALV